MKNRQGFFSSFQTAGLSEFIEISPTSGGLHIDIRPALDTPAFREVSATIPHPQKITTPPAYEPNGFKGRFEKAGITYSAYYVPFRQPIGALDEHETRELAADAAIAPGVWVVLNEKTGSVETYTAPVKYGLIELPLSRLHTRMAYAVDGRKLQDKNISCTIGEVNLNNLSQTFTAKITDGKNTHIHTGSVSKEIHPLGATQAAYQQWRSGFAFTTPSGHAAIIGELTYNRGYEGFLFHSLEGTKNTYKGGNFWALATTLSNI